MSDSCYSLALNFDIAGQFGTSIWHYHFDDGAFTSTAAAASALNAAWAASNQTALRDCLPLTVKLLSIKSRKVSAPGGFESILLRTTSNAGTRSGAIMVAGVNPCAVMIPADQSKRRGRWFIPGLSINDMTAGMFQASYMSAINTQLSTLRGTLLLTGGGGPTATLSIYSRSSNTWRAVGNFYLSSNPGRQRRRQRPV